MSESVSSIDHSPQEQLAALLRGECSADAFAAEILRRGEILPDSQWDVLALVDQYYRRGKLPADQFQTIKTRIQCHVLGIPLPAEPERGVELLAAAPAPAESAPLHAAETPVAAIRDRQAARWQQELDRVSRELQSSRALAARYLEILRSREWRRSTQKGRAFRRQWPLALGAVAGLVLSLLPAVPRHPGGIAPLGEARGPLSIFAPRMPMDAGIIGLSSDTYIVKPGGAVAQISVRRAGGTDGEITFQWWTRGSGAKPGQDFLAPAAKIEHIASGAAFATFSIPILRNPSRKHTELFLVRIGKAKGGAVLGPRKEAAVFIARNN